MDLLRGRTQSRPWDVEINDDGDFFSGIIADAGGRMAIEGRLCDLRRNVDGAGFAVVGTGRIGDVVDHVSHYTVNVQDERWKERTTRVFTQQNVAPGSGSSSQYTGCVLFPVGLLDDYGRFQPRNALGGLANVTSTHGNLAFLQLEFTAEWNDALQQLVEDDVKSNARVDDDSTSGNFTHLLANIDGTDYEVTTFDSLLGSSSAGAATAPGVSLRPAQTIVADLDAFGGVASGLWVYEPTPALETGSSDVRVYLYMPTAEPNEFMPLHAGGKVGIPPFELLRDAYNEAGIVFSTSAMQTLIDDPDFGVGWWRITEPQVVGPWAEDHIYGPYGVVPLKNSTGAVVPTKVHLPQDVASTDLFEFTKANTARQPTWQHSARDRVTAIRYEYKHEGRIAGRPTGQDWPADLIKESIRSIERTHDRLDAGQALRKEIVYKLYGVHDNTHVLPNTVPFSGAPLWSLDRFVDAMARERFERFGDAPIRGDLVGLSTTESVTEGDFVRVTLETFPAPATQGRGATRIVQTLSRVDTPAGPEFEWLDAGPSLSALVAPTLTVAPATSDPKHTIVATVSGSSSTSVGYQLQWALSTVSTGPSSTQWYDWAGQGDSTGTNTIRPLPSGRQIWARARNTEQLRIRSAWSAAADTTTEALDPPTNLASTGTVGNKTSLTWNIGSSQSPDYWLEVLISSGACPSTSLTGLVRLVPGSEQTQLSGLAQDSTFCFGIRHFDDFGGFSAADTVQVETSTTPAVAPAMAGRGIEIVFGTACT